MKGLRNLSKQNISVLACFIGGFLLNVTIEMMYRQSLSAFWTHLSSRPLAFLENVLILTLMLSLCLFFRRKWFCAMLIGAAWAALGVTNMLLLGYRISPLSAIDFSILQLDWSFIHIYASLWTVIGVILAIVLLLVGLVLLYIKCPRSPVLPIRSAVVVCVLVLAAFLLPELPVKIGFGGNVYKDVINLTEQYGFVYSFSRSLVDRGIDRPEDYSARRMRAIADEILKAEEKDCSDMPNIVYLQMESFFDVNRLEGVEFEEDPVPFFRFLKAKYPSGFFTAPSVGAGTANTEFEVLTQMDVHMFGVGEYPYKTIIQDEPCESMAYIAKQHGLSAHAIHNNTATFYDRHLVYPNLGFDSFTPLEHMPNMTYTEQGWAEDRVLVEEIRKALDSTGTHDLIYAISVQPHGPYPDEPAEGSIPVVSGIEDEAFRNGMGFYAGQLRAVDDVLRELTALLASRDEPTVLVAFGDHMPAVEIEESMLDAGNPYTTEYIVWANFPIPTEDENVKAYQLSARVLELLDMDCGTLTKFHQKNVGTGAYETELHTLQYDMLYGDRIVYYGENPFEPSEMRFSTQDILVRSAKLQKDQLIITGENFTPSSVIMIGEEEQETTFVSETELYCTCEKLSADEGIGVCQIAEDGTVLSTALVRPE